MVLFILNSLFMVYKTYDTMSSNKTELVKEIYLIILRKYSQDDPAF